MLTSDRIEEGLFRQFMLTNLAIVVTVMVATTCELSGQCPVSPKREKCDEPSPHLNAPYANLARSFRLCNREKWLTHDDASMAISAAWLSIRNTSLNPLASPKVNANWFIGFVSGRLRIAPPHWWTNAFVEFLCAGPDFMGTTTLYKEGWRYSRHGKLFLPATLTLIHLDDSVVLSGANCMSLNLRRPVFERLENGYSGLTWVSRDGITYLAFFDVFVPAIFDIVCIRNATNEILWRATCESTSQSPVYLGIGLHWIELKVHRDNLFAFGAANGHFFIEQFSTDDGKNKMRFSTTLYGAFKMPGEPK